MIGKTIAHYKIVEKLGEGGMGVVYKAEDTKLKREVAIKFLPHHISANKEERKRFEIEAQAAASLNHPNITTIYAIEEVDSELFIVMEFIDGLELNNKINSGTIPTDEAISISIQIAAGLEAAHKKGIVHRDIKSSNIMITNDGNVKIMDFGLAKVKGGLQLTQMGSAIGTIAYMSPEQARGNSVDHRTDIWSLGVVFYEMLTGCQPFKGEYEQAIIYSILNATPDPIQLYRKDIPDQIKKIVVKTLAKKTIARYQNCEQLLDDLESYLHSNKSVRGTGDKSEVEKEIAEGSFKKPHNIIVRYFNSIIRRIKISWQIILAVIILTAFSIYIFIPKLQNNLLHGKKIAVLPFINLSSDPNDEYFSDGIMEDILTQLVKISDLKVISRTTMMKYRNTNKTLKEISKELNTDVILEGSVRRDSNHVRITAQVIDAETDEHLWAESYDRNIKDVLSVQRQIAYQIVGTLKAKLSSDEKKEIDKQTTDSPEAYNAYLQGIYFLERRSEEDVVKAIYYFNEALEFDSNYAKVWTGLSRAHSFQADMGIIPLDEGYNIAKMEALKALQLDPNLAEAYARLAWIKMSYEWDWDGADEDYHNALKLEPGNASIIQSTGVLMSVLGRFDEAIELAQLAIELNPLLSTPNYNLGIYFYCTRQWDDAYTSVQKALELNPKYPVAHILIGRIFLAESKLDEAHSEMQSELERAWRQFGLSLSYFALGKKNEADSMLNKFIYEYHNTSAYQIAQIYSYREDIENAFLWLERAYQQRDGGLAEIKGDPLIDNIKNDIRYVKLLKKMNLPI